MEQSEGGSSRDIHPDFAVELGLDQQQEILTDIQERHTRLLGDTELSVTALRRCGLADVQGIFAPHVLAVGLYPQADKAVKDIILRVTHVDMRQYPSRPNSVERHRSQQMRVAVKFYTTLFPESDVSREDVELVSRLVSELEDARLSGALPDLADDLFSIRRDDSDEPV